MKKIELPLRGDNLPIEVDADRILCNDIVLPCDLTNVRLESVTFRPKHWALMCRFAEARGAQVERLGDL